MADAETAKYTVIGYRRAIEYLEQARALDCAGVDARLALCYSLWARDRKYLLLPNTDQWASGFHYARLALRGGRTSEALLAMAVAAEVLTRLIELQDNLELIAYCSRALCNLWLERLDQAEADCRSAIATNENIDAPYYLLGVIALRRGDAKSAADFCTKALTINAAHADAPLCLGQALARLQKPDEARNNIARARDLYLSQIATIEGNIRDETGGGRVWQVKKLEKERDRIKENVAICDELLGEKPLAISH